MLSGVALGSLMRPLGCLLEGLGVLLGASWEALGVLLGAMMDPWGPKSENVDFSLVL